MGNLIIRVAAILLVSTWPIAAGLMGFAIAGIADSAGNDWAMAATMRHYSRCWFCIAG